MAYTEESGVNKIEILEDGQLQIRRVTRVLKDGVVIAETYHREVYPPGEDVSTKEPLIKNVAAQVWTADVVSKFRRET